MKSMTEHNGKRNVSLLIIIALLVLIIAFLGYYAYDLKQQVSRDVAELENKQLQLENTYTKLDSISQELNDRIQEIRRLGGVVDSLLTVHKQLEKEKYELKLSKNIANEQYQKIKKKIVEYENLLTIKDAEIDLLKKQNQVLVNENESLKSTKDSLAGKVSNLTNETKVLNSKIKSAAVLRTLSIEVFAVDEKGKERTEGEYKIKHIDKLKIVYQLEYNQIVESGQKRVFIKIIEPEGTALYDVSQGSGKFVYAGTEQTYSMKQDIVFDNNQQIYQAVYNKESDYKKGRHVVELFCDNVMIGSTNFNVK